MLAAILRSQRCEPNKHNSSETIFSTEMILAQSYIILHDKYLQERTFVGSKRIIKVSLSSPLPRKRCRTVEFSQNWTGAIGDCYANFGKQLILSGIVD